MIRFLQSVDNHIRDRKGTIIAKCVLLVVFIGCCIFTILSISGNTIPVNIAPH